MRLFIIKIGRVNTVILVTLGSIIVSLLITLSSVFIMINQGVNLDIGGAAVVAVLIPAITAPLLSWHMIGLVIHIHQLEEEMRKMATYDALTGLLNRQAFMKQAKSMYKLAQREKRDFSIALADLDHFKIINDCYGHSAGDRVLKSIGEILRTITRASDLVCRYGGEEFAFFINENQEQSLKLTERLHNVIKEARFEYEGEEICCTVSIGLATFLGTEVSDLEELFTLADKGLYDAKRNGRNQTQIYEKKKTRIGTAQGR